MCLQSWPRAGNVMRLNEIGQISETWKANECKCSLVKVGPFRWMVEVGANLERCLFDRRLFFTSYRLTRIEITFDFGNTMIDGHQITSHQTR